MGAIVAPDPQHLAIQTDCVGALGQSAAHTIRQTGSPLLGGPSLFSTTLAGNFCIPATGTPLIDSAIDLPGPGTISVPGQISVCLLGLLCP